MTTAQWSVPGYTELTDLGSGSQGRVILARDDQDGTLAAIKYLAPDLLTDTRYLAVFRREAQMLLQVDNPHIARLLAHLETPHGSALIMEAVPGATLRAILDHTAEPLTPEAALLILKGSLLGLAAAHAAGVVHRDYKPANVIVQPDGTSKLIDFGIAVLAGTTSRAGTPAYMAPEQWRRQPASPATDVYAATCVFYECMTMHRPYGDDATTLEEAHLTAAVPARDLPRPLRPLVTIGMAKTPDDRPPTADAFVDYLETVATSSYGPDWEARGRTALKAAAAAIAATLPLGVHLAAHAATAHTAAHTAAHGARAILSRILSSKATAAGTGLAAAAGVTVYLLYPSKPAAPPPPPPPALTLTQARQVLAHYLTVANQADANLDPAMLATVEDKPELTMDAAYFAFSKDHHLGPVKPTNLQAPEFWIPRVAGNGQRWFAVHTGPGSTVAWTWYSHGYIADDPGPGLTRTSANSTLIFTWDNDGTWKGGTWKGGTWKLALIVDPPATSTSYPPPVLDAQGYAQQVSPTDTGYALTPGAIPAAITGPDETKLFGKGTCTADPQTPKGATPPPTVEQTGWTQHNTAAPTSYPVYALKAAGSALVWITTTETSDIHRTDPRSTWTYGVPYTGVKQGRVYFRDKLTMNYLADTVVTDPANTRGAATAKPAPLACAEVVTSYTGT